MTSGDMWAEGDELLSIEGFFFLMQISLFIKKKKRKKMKETKQTANQPTLKSAI